MDSLIRKSGYLGPPTPSLRSSLLITRYQVRIFQLLYHTLRGPHGLCFWTARMSFGPHEGFRNSVQHCFMYGN